jgi:hypothetical protein
MESRNISYKRAEPQSSEGCYQTEGNLSVSGFLWVPIALHAISVFLSKDRILSSSEAHMAHCTTLLLLHRLVRCWPTAAASLAQVRHVTHCSSPVGSSETLSLLCLQQLPYQCRG